MKTVTHLALPTLFLSLLLILSTETCFGQSPNQNFKTFVWEKSHNDLYKSIQDSNLCDDPVFIPKELIVCEWNLKEIAQKETNILENLLPLVIPIYKETKQEYILSDESLEYLNGAANEKSTENEIEEESKIVLSVYPNPANTFFTITLNENISSDEKITVELFNLNGQCCYSEIVNIGATIDVSDLPKGVYVIRAISSEKNMHYSKILVK